MTLKGKLKNTLIGLGIAGVLAAPQGLDYIVNGSYKITHIGEGSSIKNIIEYKDRVEVTGFWGYLMGRILVDKEKDGKLDNVYQKFMIRTIPWTQSYNEDNLIFKKAQLEYDDLMRIYQGDNKK